MATKNQSPENQPDTENETDSAALGQMTLDRLKPNGENPRIISEWQLEALRKSIKEFGDLGGVVFNAKTGKLVGGHQRSKVFKEDLDRSKITIQEVFDPPTPTGTLALGFIELEGEKFSYREVAWDEEKENAAMIAANKQGGEWDLPLLKEKLLELDTGDFDMQLLGFTDAELEEMMLAAPPEPPEEDSGGGGDGLAKETVCKPGDIWILGDHRLACGDSTKEEVVKALLAGAKPIIMVTDPPYGVSYDPNWREEQLAVGARSTGKVQNDDVFDWTAAYRLFNGDIVYLWHSALFTHEFAKHLESCGFEIKSQIIWVKQHFAISRGDYHWQHEPCWYAVRNGKKHNWQGARDQSTTWHIKNNSAFGNANHEEVVGHGTQKPIECMWRPIQNNTREGDFVYDPFGGSGTTLIACEKSNRKCLMIEIDPRYCDKIMQRWEKLTHQCATLERTGEKFSEMNAT